MTSSNENFHPPIGLKNPHLQTILAGAGPRKLKLARKSAMLANQAQEIILDCNGLAHLHGYYNKSLDHPEQKLAILLHGWEGCAISCYMNSLTYQLMANGYAVFRLHFRDHGPSHHLNRDLFNSSALDEVIAAVEEIQKRYPHGECFLGGFSLGGNFALRIASRISDTNIKLNQVVGICPVLDPLATMEALGNLPPYERYFMRRWKNSLSKKLRYFPDIGYDQQVFKLPTLKAMNEYLVPRHTRFADDTSYFNSYALTGSTLKHLATPCHIILSEDDPVIPIGSAENLALSDQLTVEITRYGGHCGFMRNWRFDSWADQRVIDIFAQKSVL